MRGKYGQGVASLSTTSKDDDGKQFYIDGRGVEVFLGEDYHFLDDNMGHQGSSSTYPSSLDKVTLYHLQHHGGLGPHIPLNCQVEARSLKDYLENYNENLADDRQNNNMHENGKYHHSGVGLMIFPLCDLHQLVPASFHIMLGIVLLIYNLLLEECKRIDEEEGSEVLSDMRCKGSEEWEIMLLELGMKMAELREHGGNVVAMTNRVNRFHAIANNDPAENVKLAANSDGRHKQQKMGKKNDVEKCGSTFCYITVHDINIKWVQCDHCSIWYHTMCEVMSPQEEISLEKVDSSRCNNCQGIIEVDDITKLYHAKITHITEEEEILNGLVVSIQTKCDNLKSTYEYGGRKRKKAK